MIGRKGPTEEEFGICIDVISWLLSWYEKNEPSAFMTINTLNTVLTEIPVTVEELEGDE